MANVKGIVTSIILVIVLIIVSFTIVGNTAPDLTTAAGNISASGLPLANLFASNGVLLLVFMAGLFIALMVVIFKMGGK